MNIATNVNLQSFNTLSIPSTASHFVEVRDLDELTAALNWANTQGVMVFVLGGGSNIIAKDQVRGLIIKVSLRGISVIKETEQSCTLSYGAGEVWHEIVERSVSQGLSGLENLAYIPGTVGAAPIQNIGAYGVELADVFVELTALNKNTLEEVTFTKDDCRFGYRDSVFKNELRDQFVILSVTVELQRQADVCISYPALQTYFLEGKGAVINSPEMTHSKDQYSGQDNKWHPAKISSMDVMHAVTAIRKSKLPDPKITPNAGSFFKNPVVDNKLVQELQKAWPDIVIFPVDSGRKKIPAGWLIDRLGWKGREVNGIVIHPDQALVLTNPNSKCAAIILEVADAIIKDVYQHFGIKLEIEPQVFG